MIKNKVVTIKNDIQEREKKALQQALRILDMQFDNYLSKELDDPEVIGDGYICLASNNLFSILRIDAKYLNEQGFNKVFKYIKNYCRIQGLNLKVIERDKNFFFVKIVFIEYRSLRVRIREYFSFLISRYLLSN
ncbi:hypothetical protein ACYSNR_12745 [Enterococcus sp. LJL128]|uniref:hypothetical protein n=1 Tax=Enterococcus sp. LJL51 TaxID=3416656 RepID=UPI003CF8507D